MGEGGFVFFCGGTEWWFALERKMGPRIHGDTGGRVDGAEEGVGGSLGGFLAIYVHMFHDRKGNRDCRLMARRSCHKWGGGWRGLVCSGDEILRLRCASLRMTCGGRCGVLRIKWWV